MFALINFVISLANVVSGMFNLDWDNLLQNLCMGKGF